MLAHEDAEPLLDEAVRIAQRTGLDRRLGEVLVVRSALRHELGRPGAAHRDLERASALIGPNEAATVDVQRAALAQNAGHYAEAATIYEGLLQRPGLRPELLSKAANNLGVLEARLGKHGAAARHLELAASSAGQAGPVFVALVSEGRAWAAVKAGRLAEGVARFDDAELLWESVGLPLGELYAEYTDALMDLRLLPEARAQAERAVALLDGQGVPLMAAEARLRVAELAVAMGDTDEAQDVAEETASQLRRQRRADWVARACLVAVQARLLGRGTGPRDHAIALRAARTLESRELSDEAATAYLLAGRVASASGRGPRALSDWARAADVAPRTPVLARVKRHLALALAAKARGRDDELLQRCRDGLRDLTSHRAALPSTELRVLAAGHGAELSALGLQARTAHGSAARVLEWMERHRATALSAVTPSLADEADPDLGALRVVHKEIAQARRDEGVAPERLVALQSEIEARLRRRTWTAEASGAVVREDALSTAALRRVLAGHVLVEYDALVDNVVAAVADERRVRVVELGAVRDVEADIDALRMALRSLSAAPASMVSALRDVAVRVVQRLTERLVTPLQLPESAGVVVVPAGELQRVPWSALIDRPVTVSPSAALWVRCRETTSPEGSVVVAAGPELDGAVEEAHAVAALYDEPTVMLPPTSRVDDVRRALDGASLAHLACHGTVRADNPTFSSLQLSDGQLTLHELDRRAGAPHRLVLAACDVGSSVTYPGNEVLGFVGTLLTRGTAGLVASTTLVPDHHVTPLMLALHQRIREGATLADSLHAARQTVDSDDPRAYPAWCSFTAYGAA